MTPKFTPGPWTTGGFFYPGPTQWVWGPVAPGNQSGEVIAKEISAANARLIAAAPELYGALEQLLGVFCALCSGYGPGISALYLREISQARAALDRANGEAK